MIKLWVYWLLTLLPSVPLLCLYLAFKSVLESKKFDMVTLLMRGETLTKYLAAYGRRHDNIRPDTSDVNGLSDYVTKIVNKIFWLQYSNWEYLLAIFFNILITCALCCLAFTYIGIPLGISAAISDGIHSNSVVANMILSGTGAWLWSIHEFADRYRLGDLKPDSIFSMGVRVLIVSVTGAVVGTVLSDRLAAPIAFGIGALPLSSLKDFFQSKALKQLNLPLALAPKGDPLLSKLQGWDQEVCGKLLRADITSVEQLACINPFQIFLQSNLDWRVILDLCDQALLMVYIGEKAESLRILGFRSAGELANMDWSKDDADTFSDFTRDEAFLQIASALGMEVVQVKMLIRSLSDDITVKLIATLWSDDTPGDHNDDEDEGENPSADSNEELSHSSVEQPPNEEATE